MNNNMDFQFYHIYALGFCGAQRNNDLFLGIEHRLKKVTDYIPKLKTMGINGLIIGPLFQSESHGYNTIDYRKVDTRLGDETDLIELIDVCHQNGIKVILDCVFNHVGRGHYAFKDLRDKGASSKYSSWFMGINFNNRSPYNDPFDYDTWDGHYELVKWNLKNEEVKSYLIDNALYWIKTYDIDGLRMDAANVMDRDFLKSLSRACKVIKNDFWMLGEIVGGDYCQLTKSGELNGVTNYECYKGLHSSLNDVNYFEIAYSLNRQFGPSGIMKDIGLYNFVDNHDVNRVASQLKKEEYLYPLYILLYTMPGIPSIYYLSEYAYKGMRTSTSDEALRPCYNEASGDENHPLYKTICKLSKIRSELKSLCYGDYEQLYVGPDLFAFKRSYKGEQVIVILNASNQHKTIKLGTEYNGKYVDYLNQNEVNVNGGISAFSCWGCILLRM